MPRKTTINLQFDGCFDQRKLAELAPHLPATYSALNRLCPWRKGKWPTRVHCMTRAKIVAGRRRGAGHGYTYVGSKSDEHDIWMSPYLSRLGLWMVLVHESLHHGFPDAGEGEINCVLVPQIYLEVFNKKLTPDVARKNGLGAPAPGVGDRSYCTRLEAPRGC